MSKNNKNIPNNSTPPFQAKSDYFADFEKNILAKVKQGSYHLPLGISHPFIAPKGYFESLEPKVLSQLDSKQKEITISPFQSIWKSYKTVISLAASVLLVALFSYGIYLNNKQNTIVDDYEYSLAELNTDDIISYLEFENLNTDDFSSLIDTDPDLFSTTFTEEEIMEDYSDQELLQYLDFQVDTDLFN